MVNYNEEVKKLDSFIPGESRKFWKPKAGQYKVKALTELEDADPFIKEGEEPKPQMKVKILVADNKESFDWTFSRGVSPASTYGQLCKLAVALGGLLKDKEFLVVVTSDNKKNTYTIVKL
jgi:hypothetical protein